MNKISPGIKGRCPKFDRIFLDCKNKSNARRLQEIIQGQKIKKIRHVKRLKYVSSFKIRK